MIKTLTFCFLSFSAINPILYNAMSDKFRKAFRRLLSCGKLTEPTQVPGGQHNHLYCYQNHHHNHTHNQPRTSITGSF